MPDNFNHLEMTCIDVIVWCTS